MATATAGHATTKAHIERLQKKVLAVKQAVDALPGDDFYTNLFNIMHRPGWTTLAEGLFFEAVVDSMLTNTQQLTQLHAQLMAGAQAVGQE